jgi:hypothetical protein
MLSGLKAWLSIGVLAAAAVGGAWVARSFYATDLVEYKALTKQLSVSVNRQNAAVRVWAAESAKLKARIAAAEARQPEIVTRTEWRIKETTATAPAAAAPCVEVRAWQRERYAEFCSRWQRPPQ